MMTREIIKGIARTETQNLMLEAKDTDYFAVAPPYTEYVALISQGLTGDPTVTIFFNTIGNIIWSRIGTGQYRGTLSGAFGSGSISSVVGFVQASSSYAAQIAFLYVSDDEIEIRTAVSGVLSDDLLTNNSLMIRVYPVAL